MTARMIATALVLAALALLSVAPAHAGEFWRDLWGWGPDPLRETHERLFDTPYEKRPYDWFNREHPFEDVREFNHQFDLRSAGISTGLERADKQVTLVVVWPGSAGQPLEVTVADDEVRVRPPYSAPRAQSAYRFRAASPVEVRLPVPPHARASSAKPTRDGDVVRVAFDTR